MLTGKELHSREQSLASHQEQKKQKQWEHKEMKSICCRSISIFYLLNSCLANAGSTAWKQQTPVGHRDRQGQWLPWLSSPAVNTSVGSHCICAVWMLLAWQAKPLSAAVTSVLCLLYTEETSHGAELAASIALLQEGGQGVGEPGDSEDNPPPLRQRSCHGCPCHPSHPASELPPSACKLFREVSKHPHQI